MSMKKRVFQELKKQYEKKFANNSMFEDFFKRYILDTIKDEDILLELNKRGRDLSNLKTIDYLENEAILIRTIRVCVLLELSRDYLEFKRFNEKIEQDKQTVYDIEFEKLLKALMKIETK